MCLLFLDGIITVPILQLSHMRKLEMTFFPPTHQTQNWSGGLAVFDFRVHLAEITEGHQPSPSSPGPPSTRACRLNLALPRVSPSRTGGFPLITAPSPLGMNPHSRGKKGRLRGSEGEGGGEGQTSDHACSLGY